MAPFLPQALTLAAAKIIFAFAAEQLEQAVLISPTDQSWKKRTSFHAPNASYLIKQVEHIQISEYPLKWATYPINWQDLKQWDKEDKVINCETEKKKKSPTQNERDFECFSVWKKWHSQKEWLFLHVITHLVKAQLQELEDI